jgi:AraC-like DNA-binding protein
VTSRPAAAQHLRDLARLRRVRDRIDREYAQPLDVEALARGAHMSAGTSAASSGSPTASRRTDT